MSAHTRSSSSKKKLSSWVVPDKCHRAYVFPEGHTAAYLNICSSHAACRRGPKTPPELDIGDSARAPVMASRSDSSPPYAEERSAATASSELAVAEEDVVVAAVVEFAAVTSEKLVAAVRPNACVSPWCMHTDSCVV